MILELFPLSRGTALLLQISALISCGLIWLTWLKPCKRSNLLPGVYVAGVAAGKISLPQARRDFIYNCADFMLEGYQKTEGGLFYVPSPAGERLMIPTKYLDELKNSANNEVDFTASFSEMFEGQYTTIGQKWHLHPNVVKTSLNGNLELIMPDVYDEIIHAFQFLLPASDDWKPVRIAEVFTQIISRASNRMLGGKSLSRNRDWTDTSINFTTDTWLASQKLKEYPAWLRPIVQHILPEMNRVRHHFTIAQQVICPLVQIRSEIEKKSDIPIDLLQMLWEAADPADKTPNFMAYTALAISFAAIRTSSSVPTHLLYDLCARSEYIQPLREEVQSVLSEEGNLFTKGAMNKLFKLDSFMKESQRFNPLSLLTFGRVMQTNRTLHDGLIIPKGTIIGAPAHAISQDAAFFPSPSKFQPFRFVPSTPGEKTAGFVTTNASSSLSWGYGKHACSGRFFAANEIKLIMAHLLLNYDFKFAGGRTERPANYTFELQNMPDENVEVLVRRRSEVTAVTR